MALEKPYVAKQVDRFNFEPPHDSREMMMMTVLNHSESPLKLHGFMETNMRTRANSHFLQPCPSGHIRGSSFETSKFNKTGHGRRGLPSSPFLLRVLSAGSKCDMLLTHRLATSRGPTCDFKGAFFQFRPNHF